jgi:hemerythrin-like metal-binding protein
MMHWYSVKKTGVPEIDLDHTNIDNYLNYAIDKSFSPELLAKLVSALLVHFEREEGLCRERTLNFTQEHKAEHQRLAEQLQQIDYDSTTQENLLFFFKQMLASHIEDFDIHLNPG